jgi:hypothetical protein
MVLSAMIAVTYLPLFITLRFRGMPGMWKGRHRLFLCWLIVMQALFPGRKTLAELARWTLASITVWRLRRVLKGDFCTTPRTGALAGVGEGKSDWDLG